MYSSFTEASEMRPSRLSRASLSRMRRPSKECASHLLELLQAMQIKHLAVADGDAAFHTLQS
eukprot:scaffold2556_cov425-Prasinococcus_capsulatus_cf.AAC.2